MGSVDHLLGLLSTTLGNLGVVAQHFESALGFCRESGYRPEYAHAASDYAEVLFDRDEPGDRDKAIELQDEAIAIAQELGMTPLLERVLSQREMLKA